MWQRLEMLHHVELDPQSLGLPSLYVSRDGSSPQRLGGSGEGSEPS